MSEIAPDRVPVKGTDGKYHLAYELSVLNASPRDATITKVETLANNASGPVVSTISGAQVVGLSLIVGDYTIPPVPAKEVKSGETVLLILDTSFATSADVPTSLVHRITATFGPSRANQADFADNFPARSVQTGAAVKVSSAKPVVIGPPLTGKNWVAVNACCELSPHRGAMLPSDSRINGAERFAVDWSRFDLTAVPIADLKKGTQATFSGDPTRNESYFTFGQPVIAVADATVVTAVGSLPEAPPHTFIKGLPIADLGGNRVVLKLADGVYAFYAHLKTGSLKVKVGDHVTRGQVLAQAGNSGNTTESHLHFHMMDTPEPLTADNIPWEIDHFDFEGDVTPEKLLPAGAGARSNELPLINTAMGFPDVG